jgi:hypothetical protein
VCYGTTLDVLCVSSAFFGRDYSEAFFLQVSRNWASHDTPLGTPVPSRIEGEIPRVSAGKIMALALHF